MAEREYKRLTRSRPRSQFSIAVTSRVSLWEGKDHLLLIDTNGYTENYRRFYFRDIQTISVSQTNGRAVWNGIWGALTGVTAALWLPHFAGLRTAPQLWEVLAASGTLLFFALPLLINNLLGSTCVCLIQTAVQHEELAPLRRARAANRIIQHLLPTITAAQPADQAAPIQAASPGPAGASTTVISSTPAESVEPSAEAEDPNLPPRILS
jgi:hypothetical protein